MNPLTIFFLDVLKIEGYEIHLCPSKSYHGHPVVQMVIYYGLEMVQDRKKEFFTYGCYLCYMERKEEDGSLWNYASFC